MAITNPEVLPKTTTEEVMAERARLAVDMAYPTLELNTDGDEPGPYKSFLLNAHLVGGLILDEIFRTPGAKYSLRYFEKMESAEGGAYFGIARDVLNNLGYVLSNSNGPYTEIALAQKN